MRFLKWLLLFLIFASAFAGGLSARYFTDSLSALARYSAEASFLTARMNEQIESAQIEKRAKREREYTLLFVGDIMLSRAVGREMERRDDYAFPFRLIADELRAADFAFGNLEGPISARGKNQGSIYSFRADPRAIEGLVFAGFDALSLANNHIWDWGREALEDTITALKTHNIQPAGAGLNYEEANDPALIALDDTQLALFAYTNLMPRSLEATESRAGLSQFEPDRIKKAIFNAKQSSFANATGGKAGIVIVSLHWGEEYVAKPSPQERAFARELVDAGADLVIGHHPHVIQEVERYKQGWIAYSLGNFVFDQGFSEETIKGLVLKITIREKRIIAVEQIRVRINDTFQSESIGSY